MKNKTALILTTISKPNKVMNDFAKGCKENNIDFIVTGDLKSPADFKLNGCNYYSVDDQKKLKSKLAKNIPDNHYSKKNIGYIIAKDHDVILESDDDNYPRKEFWDEREKLVSIEVKKGKGWYNAYSHFSDEYIWPRGFPLEELSANRKPLKGKIAKVVCPIQQGLADANPDVDAVYRMIEKLPFDFKNAKSIALAEGTWCPFNSQNTTWYKEAFPLLYLPSYCSFRMTDIWRSFIAQRVAWSCDWNLMFTNATVWQDRNAHNLLRDFQDEIPGYLGNAKICKLLEDCNLLSGLQNIRENILRCYRILIENEFFPEKELKLVDQWLTEI